MRRAVDAGELSVDPPERVVVTPPGAGGCGDYATNVALQLARPAGQPALRVADVLRGHLLDLDGIRDVSVTGPGFLNISLRAADADAGAQRLVEEILRRGERYGHADPGAPSRAVELRCRREPRALVHADVVARLLRAVHGDTVRIRCVGVSAGAGSGAGAGVSHAGPPPPPASAWADLLALPADISLTAADAPADVHFSADTPADTSPSADTPADVSPFAGTAADTSPSAGPRADASPSAAAPADVSPFADTPADLGPATTAPPDGNDTPATPVTLDIRPTPAVPAPAPPEGDLAEGRAPAGTPESDLLSLGPDAARWALLHPAPHDRPRPGRAYLVQRESNPLFRVRYAHARARALLRNAADLGFGPEPGPVDGPGARALLAVLADHPRVLDGAATHRAPDRLARHLVNVADAALPYLVTVLPLGEEKPSAAHRARLALAEAAGTVLAGGLSLLGIDAPDHL
ncbi:ArgS-related anticodon-binding protein NrtL [Streptomyces sp. BBFR109]|uniref:ArgS-related anticodon-binding protein NrtL n=1 Tax=Streptomyces sp. BBFR109 TaxID=3448172 RepID=UPI003F75A9E7